MRHSRITAFAATLCLSLYALPAAAIPAPDLIVSSVSSLSQLFALLSVILGGGAVFGSRWAGDDKDEAAHERLRWLRRGLIGCLVLLVTSIGFNIWQMQTRDSERNDRLQATLVRPTREEGKPVLDTNIRDIAFRNQIVDSKSISTDSVAALLAEKSQGKLSDYVFVDIREKVEASMGLIPGFNYLRFPDFVKSVRDGGGDLKNKQIIVMCHNGNRSHEAVEDMVADGYSAKYIAGGFEKWLTESRPVIGIDPREITNLRATPPYRNSEVLLDTPDVHALVRDEKAIFLDIRYDGEFAAGHLPRAININMRPMPSVELEERIRALPRQPIIIPCYNRRSCFGALVMGYELTQVGYDFRGRYTVPWEYYERPPVQQELPHVARWQEARDKTLLDRVTESVAAGASWLSGISGTLVAGIVLLAVIMRLLVLPITLKAERDQIRMAAIKGEMDSIKSRLQSDRVRLMRAMRALYKRNGLTPGRNLLSLLFLPLFVVSIASLDIAAAARPEPLLWMPDLAAPDPWFVLPVIFAVLIAVYIERSLAMAGRKRLLLWLIGVPLLAFAMIGLSAAGNLYAVVSAVLILLQRAWLKWRAQPANTIADGPIVPLSQAHLVPGSGMKAARLGRLIEAGFPVPRGVVLRNGSDLSDRQS